MQRYLSLIAERFNQFRFEISAHGKHQFRLGVHHGDNFGVIFIGRRDYETTLAQVEYALRKGGWLNG